MKQNIEKRMTHALIAMMLTTGVLMPVLGVMDRSFLNPRMLIVSAAIIALFEIITVHRISSLVVAAAAVTCTAVWSFSPDGKQIMSDLIIALSLRIRGIETSLPLIADSAMIITTCLITILCCISCIRKASFIPVLLLCLGASLPVWLTGRTDLIPWLLPGLIALLTTLMVSGFTETRSVRILPWAVAVVLFSFFVAGGGATIPALKDHADEFRKSVMDRLFFTEARDVFSLYSVGFSPQGPDQLGGKPDPTDDPVMLVSTTKTAYLRGAVYDEYTGHGWLNTAGGKRFLWQSDRLEEDRIAIFDQNLPSETFRNNISPEFTVSVRMLCDSTSTLFVPQRIRELIPGGNMVPYYSNSSEIFITRNLQPGDTYSVRAALINSDQEDIGNLVELCGSIAHDPVWDNMPDLYYQLPDHLEPSVYELARSITRNATSDYSKAIAISDYLKEYEYTMDVEQHPENYDFVTTFLLNTKRGYCTYFASAMTVLCRMNGLPARYVEGYLAEPDSRGEACVTGLNAHAWTEVYFKGFGWLTFDATPGTIRNGEGGSDPDETDPSLPVTEPVHEPPDDPTPSPAPESVPDPTPGPTGETTPPPANSTYESTPDPTPEPTESPTTMNVSDSADGPAASGIPPESSSEGRSVETSLQEPFPWFLIPLVLFTLFILRIILTSPSVRDRLSRTEIQKANVWIQEISDILTSENISRKKGETLLGFAERVDRTGFFTTVIRPVGEAASVMIYSCYEVLPESTALIRDTAVMLRSETGKPAKFRYWIRRIFLPARRKDWRQQ